MTIAAEPFGSATERLLDTVRARLGPRLTAVDAPSPQRLFLTIEPSATVETARALFDDAGARYVISVGVDRRPGLGFEVLHCFALDADHVRGLVRVPLPGGAPRIPSITPVVRGASWAELEMRDLLGIEPEGHPDPRRLVLPDGFPADLHPLRKDFAYNTRPPLDGGERYEFRAPPPGTTSVPLGPFFPVLEEPSQWRLFVDGESVVGCDYRGFYCHRGVEKLADSVLNYNQVVSLAERICGICGCVHSTAYCQAVEEAAGIEVPIRARVIRTFVLELERLQSHLLWLGLACHIVGFDFVFMQSWRMREPVMGLAEHLTGSRKHFSCNLVGGTLFDIPREKHARVRETLAVAERESLELLKALEGDEALIARLRGSGVLTAGEARALGAVGPTARGSGLPLDARRDHPYAAYALMTFDVVTDDAGDNWSRTKVRLGEIFESIRIMRQCVDLLGDLSEGGIMAAMPDALPPWREGMHAVEAPRGEVFHYVMTGERNGPWRWRVRAPSYQNLQCVPVMLKPGTTVADVPITIGSVDPCFSCTERMEIVDVRRGGARVWKRSELDAHARADMERRRGTAAGPRVEAP